MSRPALLGLLAAALGLAALGLGWWVAAQQPLAAGSTQSHFTTTYRHGERFSWEVSVANAGRFPVALTDVHFDDAHGLFRPLKVDVFADHGRRGVELPARIASEDELRIVVDAVFAGCRRFARNAWTTLKAIDVSYELLGIPRRTWVEFGDVVTVRSPDRCPER